MVLIRVKHGDDNFFYEAAASEKMETIMKDLSAIYNGRLKVNRICMEIEDICEHGLLLPPEMIGLTDEQVSELKLTDPWAEKHIPLGGYDINIDKIGRRNGRAPKPNMQKVLKNTIKEAKELINIKLVQSNKAITLKTVEEAIKILKDALTFVYPMGLPPHEIVCAEFSNTKDLDGTAASKDVIDLAKVQPRFAGKKVRNQKKNFQFGT